MAPGGHQSPGDRAQAQRVRSLRIGIILGGKIIEEKLLRTPQTVTVGQSAKNTFSVPVEGLPRTWPLFTTQGELGYVLNFADGMDGRLSDGSGVYTFEQLKAGPAVRKGNGYSMKLSDASRGKITFGEMTILFQFVKAPPIQPRPKLPQSVRGTLADRIDPVLAVIMLISIAFHGIFAYWLYQRDIRDRTKLEIIASNVDSSTERTAELFVIPEQPVEEAVGDDGGGDDGGGDDKPSPTSRKRGGDDAGSDDGGGGPPSDAAIAEAVEDTAIIGVLTGGVGGTGSRYSEMSGTDPGGDLDKSLENIGSGGGRISSRGEGGLGRGTRGPQTGEIGTGTGGAVAGPGDTGRVGGAKGQVAIESRSTLGDVEDFDGSSLDPETVAQTIRRRYLKGIKRCHEQLLKVDPRAGGRVEIEITVGKVGNVVRASVRGFDSGVDSCIKALALKWRFPPPKTDGGAPTESTFAMPFILKAGG
jgi:hypothetical protein